MKILLAFFATIGFVASLGSPLEYQRETFETRRNPNIQVTQNSGPEELKPTREHYQTSRSDNMPARQEYRRFGKEASSLSSQADSLPVDYSTNERKISSNQNSENQATFSNNNQVSKFPPVSVNEGTQVQKSSFLNQDLRTAYSPASQVQTSFSSQDNRRSGIENAEGQTPVTSIHNQEHYQKGTPFVMERQLEIQSGLYQNTFGASHPTVQEQISQTTEAAFQNQENFRSPIEDQRFQTQQTFYQNDARRDQGAIQNQQSFQQQPAFPKQDQMISSRRSQEQISQYQQPSQQSQRSPSPSSSYEKDGFFNQGQVTFDSRRISAPAAQPMERTSRDENQYIASSSQFPRSQHNEKSQNRQINEMKSNIRFSDDRNVQTENPKQSLENIQDDRQGFYHTIKQNQPALNVPKYTPTNTAVLVSGTKSAAALPVMVYKTSAVASPHAVVLGQDLSVLNKASVSQHLQTPFTQYTYTHPL